jgi:hypothetical protein
MELGRPVGAPGSLGSAMASSATDDGGRRASIEFTETGNSAQVAWAGRRQTLAAHLAALGIAEPRPILLVVGGAESMESAIEPQLARQLERGAIRAAAEAGAVVLDGGTASGVMATLGRASAASDATVVLVGVAPAGRVTFDDDVRPGAEGRTKLEPNHTHFLLANSSEWGGETSLLLDVLDGIARDRPAVVLVAGGGAIAVDEVEAASGRGLPVVALDGSGGLADVLAGRANAPAVAGVDPARVTRLAASADVVPVKLAADPSQLARILARLLQFDETLRDAWRKQSLVSQAAKREQQSFRNEQTLVLILGVILTFFVVASTVLHAAGVVKDGEPAGIALYVAILIVPITVGTIVAAAGRMRPGTRWILLRGTSETLKREIYRYRARSGIYSHEHTHETPRETKLALAVGSAIDALMRTDVNLLALDPDADRRAARLRRSRQQVPAEDAAVSPERLTPLTAAGYVKQRIDEQVAWYQENAARLSRNSRTLQWLALLFGAGGTFLAAINLQIWVAVTTAIVGAYSTYRATWQLETSLALYNQAASNLSAIRLWWFALSPAEQARQANIDKLVEGAEHVLKAEQSGWVQEMQDAMAQLRLEPTEGAREPGRDHGEAGGKRRTAGSGGAPADSGVQPKPDPTG